jgi:vacuolar-type H+-ATPase subunit I/STV1
MDLDEVMILSEQYQLLLLLYDKVLDLSEKILKELEGEGAESNIVILVEQKKVAGEAIKQMIEKIASTEIRNKTDSDLKTLALVKSLLKEIAEKTQQIQEVEEKIQKFLQEDG